MLDTPEAVVEALRENNERPHGLQRTVTAEELAEAAEPFEEPDVLVTALLELMAAYEFTGEHRKSPVVFARLLKLWEDSPEAFSQWEAHQVFWRFKWVTTSLLQVPDVPLATVQGWIGRMSGFYEAAGHEVQPVAAMRYHLAAHTGTGADDAFDLWATRPRSELSDCEACETRYLAWHRVSAGDDAGALDSWRPVLEGAQACTEEPQMSQARALLPLLRTGRADEARSHHLTGYRRVRGNTGMLDEVGLHLEFCALSRNEGRGLEILAENRPLFGTTGAPLALLGFLTGVEVLLARIVGDGHGAAAVAGPPGRNWTAGELLAHVRGEAERLAAAFDGRNGTTAVGDRRRARLAQLPLCEEPLPLGLRSPVVRSEAPEPSPAAGAGAAVPEVPEDFAGLVREARRLGATGHPGAARLWTRVEDRLAAGEAPGDGLGPGELLSAELAEHRALVLSREDRGGRSVSELRQAAELFGRAGAPWRMLSARARALAWESVPDEDGEGAGSAEGAGPDGPGAFRAALDEVLHEAERLKEREPLTGGPAAGADDTTGGPGQERVLEYLTVLFSRAFAAYQEVTAAPEGAQAAAMERFEECVGALRSEAEGLGVPHQVANARQFAADLAFRRGDAAEAEEELRAALVDVESSGRPWRGSRPRVLLAQALLARSEPGEASELLHRAIGEAVRYDDTEFPLAPAYALLGHAATHLGDAAGAVRHLSEAAARFDRDGALAEAADIRLQLADVLARDGQQADAVAVLESVLAGGADGVLDERMLAQARLTLARGLRELGEHLAAAEEFLLLADAVAGWEEDGPILTMVAADAATALAEAERWEAAEAAYERAVEAHAQAPNPAAVTAMMGEFARLVMAGRGPGGLDAALGHLARADEVRTAVPEDAEDFAHWYVAGMIHYRRARVLAECERFAEALAEAEASVAAHEEGGENGEEPRAEAVRIAALIEGNGLGRYAQAVTRLTEAARRCRHAGLEEAARILGALRQDFLNREGS
ncbi:hypothetical protein [Streptomyces sp. C10-9-1]|uniref:hypothetical protein n=1 Tax=Streptomyces sp. C10-9-1 TaxID=1859285 RepID=UPI003F49C36E